MSQIKGYLVTILPMVKNTKKLHDKSKTDYEQTSETISDSAECNV